MVYAVITFAVILGVYVIGNYLLYTLPIVEAGPIYGVKHTGIQRMPNVVNSSYRKVSADGKSYKYCRFYVQGECMVLRKILPKSTISVRMFENEDKKTIIKPNDIVLIFLNDENFRGYKIRAVRTVEDNVAKTFYYDKDGNEVDSSMPHSIPSIIGIVDLKESGIAA